jgi:RNA polymerase sigma-70 factor (ECF subfamily)
LADGWESSSRQIGERELSRLYGRAHAERWNLSETQFARALERSAAGRFRDAPSPSPFSVLAYLESLNLEDVALSSACEIGIAQAWDHFVTEYRPILYAAARAATREETDAREIADSLYAELWGLRGEERNSLLRFFHGRSSLATWLRAVVAQRHIDARRAVKRDANLEKRVRLDPDAQPRGFELPDMDRPRLLKLLREVLSQTLARTAPQERLRLALYYLKGLTLAEVGGILAEHESTVWRKLKRTARQLRREVERTLHQENGLSDEEIGSCCAYALEEGVLDLGNWVVKPELSAEIGAGSPEKVVLDRKGSS